MRVSIWLYLIEQTLTSICLLTAVGTAAGLTRHSPLRLMITALLLSLLSAAAAMWPPWLRLLTLPCALASPLMAWPGVPARLRLRMVALGGCISLWLAALIRFAAPMLPGALAVLAGAAALRLAPRFLRRAADAPSCATVEIRYGHHRLTLTALVDTGNLLMDAVTGLPVTVISRRAAARLIGLPAPGTILPGMRLMTVRTISGTALMTIFRPESFRILRHGRWESAGTVIGLAPDGYEGFQALVPAGLFTQAALPCHSISQGG